MLGARAVRHLPALAGLVLVVVSAALGGPASVRTPGVPYTTRILVRRPAKASHSSGSAVVEMLNPTNQFDLNIGWSIMREQLLRSGDAWVGITIRPIAVDA